MGKCLSGTAVLKGLGEVQATGCLFDDELCKPYEFCVNDGVFGSCQELAHADLYTYDISSSALQRLRTLLQKLAHRGLTWQDDITQQVISRELAKLRNVPLRHLATPPSPPTLYGSSRDRKLRPVHTELNRNLQKYLTGLGFLSQSELDGHPGLQRAEPGIQSEDIQSNGRLEPSRSKPQQGWKTTTVFSHQKGADQPPVTKVFTQSGEGRHPHLATAFSKQDPGRSKLLSSQLDRLLSGEKTNQQQPPGDEAPWPKGKLHYLSYIRPPQSDTFQPQSRVGFGSETSRPNLDRLLFNPGSIHQTPPKEPLSVMDERFIHNVVNQLGRHSVDMESLMGKDLDHLADVITGALREQSMAGAPKGSVADDPRVNVGGYREPPKTMELDQGDHDMKSDKGPELKEKEAEGGEQQAQQIDGGDKKPIDKHAAFLAKLLHYLDRGPPGPGPVQKMVGIESVHSRTTQGQVPAAPRWEEKPAALLEKDPPALGSAAGLKGHNAQVDAEIAKWIQGKDSTAEKKQPGGPQRDMKVKTQLVHVAVKEFSSRGKDRHFGYIITNSDSLTTDRGSDLMERLAQRLNLHAADLTQLSVLGPALTFRVGPNPKNTTTADFIQVAVEQKQQLEKETGLKILEAGVSDRGSLTQIPVVKETRVESGQFLLLSVLCMLFILVALAVSGTFFCVRQRSHLRLKEKLSSLGTDTSTDATATYQELCRQRMAIRTSERVERPETLRHSRLNSVSSQFSDGPAASPSTRSSTSSWCEEPVPSNMDISTGHMILSYMEDHLKNKNRLEREWEALCSYQAEPSASNVGQGEPNSKRNRSDAVVVYDHSRISLKAENNHGNSDYINASPIMDHDPRNPTYISSQGPLPSTVADFWQMVWESGCVVIVMLTPLSENGVKQCHHYWPDEGSDVYHIYEVNLVSEHIWCEDFLVRSFYLKNLQTNETRTVTQFHFLSWMDRGIPNSARTLLDFRRKVNKCYRGRSCPIIVHCSDGAGRSGTYILIDMVLNRMAKGAKEIDIAATLEHLRDQRAGMVQTKEQFEFGLTAVAEEVNAILKALPQ
ncbi:receptor-type tyrosine-protein phosphatase N2 [Genypterus blacodes]|uniref:receptor-type tyrosine-protein phosphatase N2 n=1 Tax=Genypterus blacodes TaxID=154954 RepID=UPI003F75AA7F